MRPAASFYTAIQSAVTDGRGGLGSILVNGTHNSGPGSGGVDGNSSGFDANRFYIHVGGVYDVGDVAPFVTAAPTMLGVGLHQYPGGRLGHARATSGPPTSPAPTAIARGDYTDSFGGTSARHPAGLRRRRADARGQPQSRLARRADILAASARHTGSAIGAWRRAPTRASPGCSTTPPTGTAAACHFPTTTATACSTR